jgi:hypothetical protein
MAEVAILNISWLKREEKGPSKGSEESGLPKLSKSESSNRVADSKGNGVESNL